MIEQVLRVPVVLWWWCYVAIGEVSGRRIGGDEKIWLYLTSISYQLAGSSLQWLKIAFPARANSIVVVNWSRGSVVLLLREGRSKGELGDERSLLIPRFSCQIYPLDRLLQIQLNIGVLIARRWEFLLYPQLVRRRATNRHGENCKDHPNALETCGRLIDSPIII